jgi:hypothetical protein
MLYADIIQKPYTFRPGQVIKSAEINANFDTIYNEFNGNITGTNIKENSISKTKLQGYPFDGSSDILNASIPKTKLMGYPFIGYADIEEATIYDTQIHPDANISYTKLSGVVNAFTNQVINGIKTLNNIWTYSDSIASDTSLFINDGQIPTKRYVDWKVSQAGGSGGNWPGSYPVVSADISNGAVINSKIADNAVSSSKIQDEAITTSKLSDYSVNETKLADNSVSTSKIQNGAITIDKLASNSVDSSKIVNGSITNEDISPTASISLSKLASYPFTTTDIQDNAITTSKIQNNAITTSKIQDNAITTAKIQDNSITETKIQNNAITTSKIQDGSITKSKIAILDGVIQYETTYDIQYDTDIVHKKYVDDKFSASSSCIYSAVGTTDISTTSTTFVDMPDMIITQTFPQGTIFISFGATFQSAEQTIAGFRIMIDDTEVKRVMFRTYSDRDYNCINYSTNITAGTHTIKIQWCRLGSYTINQEGATYKRVLTVITGQ